MIKRPLVVVPAVIGLAIGFVAAWHYWPPLLRYRESLAIAEARTTVHRYLDGRDSLDVAAHRLANALRKWDELAFRSGEPPAPGTGSMIIESLDLAPTGVSENDPRFEELSLNAMRLSVPAVPSAEFKARVTAQLDSVLLARGYQIVR